jgi:hypothetical protein
LLTGGKNFEFIVMALISDHTLSGIEFSMRLELREEFFRHFTAFSGSWYSIRCWGISSRKGEHSATQE